jgi:hypothetical protein
VGLGFDIPQDLHLCCYRIRTHCRLCHGLRGWSQAFQRRSLGLIPVRLGFVVDEVAGGQSFRRLVRFSPFTFIPPVLYHRVGQTQQYLLNRSGHWGRPEPVSGLDAVRRGNYVLLSGVFRYVNVTVLIMNISCVSYH